MPPEKRDERAPLTDYERYLLKKLSKHPGEWSTEFKADLADYVSVNGSLHVSSMPTLKGEEWQEVGATGQPAFQGTWVNFGASLNSAAFYKDSLGIVHLKGVIKDGTVNTTAFTLPAGYRPVIVAVFSVVSNNAFGQLNVDGDGNVVPAVGNNAFFSLDGISFRAA